MTFRESVNRLVEISDRIRDGFAAGDEHAAHEPLHEVGHVLEQVGKLAPQEGFTKEMLESVEQAKEELFTAFGNIDKKMHGGTGSTYDDESKVIESALKVIQDAVKSESH